MFVFNFKERKSQICTKERCVCLFLFSWQVTLFPPHHRNSSYQVQQAVLSLHLALPLSAAWHIRDDCSLQLFRFPFLPLLSLLLPLLSSYEHLKAQSLDWISPQNSRLTYPAAMCLSSQITTHPQQHSWSSLNITGVFPPLALRKESLFSHLLNYVYSYLFDQT